MALTAQSALRKDLTNADCATFEHRHFATIAAILRRMNATRAECETWADEMSQTNPRFNRKRFLAACEA